MKNNELIDTASSGGKYTGGTIRDATLVINNVNEHDAGSYQCKASNALGTTLGDIIVLGIPEPQVQRPEKGGNGTLAFTAMTNSCPAVFLVQWSTKNKDNDEYTPIDVNLEEYKGTSNSLPSPVLVIRTAQSHDHAFKIEAQNFIGTGTKKIPGKVCVAKYVK
ncbi:uncharacterized protein LOC134260459 [Saccostrea cucullata]|uniref:uncharacterized protein LOC134260459 n=1 Tax=Saccostrea cuccullata TaxID=36930 RepID=UPI002ED521C2